MAVDESLITALASSPAVLDARSFKSMAFLSDVHLQASEWHTFTAWAAYVSTVQADALFVLGDLFETWVGDDVLQDPNAEFERGCLRQLHAVSQRMPVFWVAGNRDFLLGSAACAAAGMQALNDPCVLQTTDGNWLLSHGDALCLSDTEYLDFRRMVRAPEWQLNFLSRPLHDRLQMVQQMRAQSQARKATQTVWADVDSQAAIDWLNHHQAKLLIHGHTHQAALHHLNDQLLRYVLSDWEANSQPPRLQAFEWHATGGFKRKSLTP